jgi:hypothetical protein
VAAADRPEVVALLDRFLAGTATPADLRLAADIFPAKLLSNLREAGKARA